MTCARCAALEAEVAAMRRELAYEVAEAEKKHLRRAFSLSPQQAAILVALHAAKGRPVQNWALAEAAGCNPEGDPVRILHVQLCWLRKRLPAKAITSLDQTYRLEAVGREAVDQAMAWRAYAA